MAPPSGPIRTTCPYCGVGCGLVAERGEGGAIRLRGDPDHPASFGRLCAKGAALDETLGLEGRLLQAEIGGRRASLDQALDTVARGFSRIIAEHGPDAVAFYLSGQLLTEDYYVANKLAKGFIGTANVDTNSRLCMSSAVAGHKRAFGEDLVPVCYDDVDHAELVVLVGSNTAWCHPVLHQRIVRAKEARPSLFVVAVDPRRTATAELADLHLPIRSGTDVWLFDGLLAHLHRHGATDGAFVAAHTTGYEAALAAAEAAAGTLDRVAGACGVDVRDVGEFYRRFASSARALTLFSQGVNQSTSGVDKVTSIINCHLATGRIGKRGAGPFSVTGQPNAMGGREVGAFANALAAHMELDRPEHRHLVQEFWGSPRIATEPGLKAVDLFAAVGAGRVKAVWIAATNPVVSLPDADRVRDALERCELVVVSEVVARTDTTSCADVLLPALAWGEKDGTVTNSERRISRCRAFLPAPGAAKPDWWLFAESARRMGFGPAFPYRSARDVFVEHARLSAFRNAGARAFDLGGLAELSAQQYDDLAPLQWPVRAGAFSDAARLFADGRFATPDGRARFVPTTPRPPANAADAEFPLVLNTGRVRDQWHTMTRTGRSPKLGAHSPEPFVDMNANDAVLAGVRAGELVRVTTRWGSLVARLVTSGRQARGAVFVPIHWSDQHASDGRVGALVNPAVDPLSGEPEFKHTPADVRPFAVDWHGFVLARSSISTSGFTWWTRIPGRGFVRHEVAGRGKPRDWSGWARALLGAARGDEADWLEYSDLEAGRYRAAWIVEGRLHACLFVSSRPDLPPRGWLESLFAAPRLGERERAALLAGAALGRPDAGPLVCSCHGVGRETIVAAIRARGLSTTRQIGEALRAGTNCGACVPEIQGLLASAGADAAARD